MTRRFRRLARTPLLVPVLAALTLAAAAPSPPQSQETRPLGRFRLSLHEGPSPSGRVLARAVLNCFPSDGSTHPHPAQACEVLSRARGDFAALRPHNRPCPMVSRPVTAVAEGTWRGEPRGFAHTYANRCAAETGTARVFALAPSRGRGAG
ncbi:SSI family serine proteinase inhibitor [Streptomyces albus subsp. chlorinus]|uniref:SSI family serine proteinase inhibitor n=1 Tax=Streptomyces albus TaxID=1888 RepID=UPI00157143AF|nr:SSI family serine proteinase inhibitor [Streptomyces albus]